MKEARGNLWSFEADAIVITTNGYVKGNGECAMGRGCARQARDLWPGVSGRLGRLLREHGNRCFRLGNVGSFDLVSMPVKPALGPEGQPGFRCDADLELIEQSARQLLEMADTFGWETVVMPRPGCGNGRLSWENVGPRLAAILDDRFTAVTYD